MTYELRRKFIDPNSCEEFNKEEPASLWNLFGHDLVVILGDIGIAKTSFVTREIERNQNEGNTGPFIEWPSEHRILLSEVCGSMPTELQYPESLCESNFIVYEAPYALKFWDTNFTELQYPESLCEANFIVDEAPYALRFWNMSLENLINKSKVQNNKLLLVFQSLTDEQIKVLEEHGAEFIEVIREWIVFDPKAAERENSIFSKKQYEEEAQNLEQLMKEMSSDELKNKGSEYRELIKDLRA